MSSYSEITHHRSIIPQNEIRMRLIQALNPKPQDLLLHQSRTRINCLFIILLVIYLKIFLESRKMINEISSKDEYFRQQWLIEQERIADQKRNLRQFLNDYKSTSDDKKKSCGKCFDWISMSYEKELFGIYEKNQDIKEEYRQTLLPLQYLFGFLCLLNNALILIIFEKSIKFYSLSNILLIICVFISGGIFLPPEPNVSYTLYIGWSIIVFTIYLLMKVFLTFLIIKHYHSMDL